MIKSTHMKSMFVASGVLAASVCFAAARLEQMVAQLRADLGAEDVPLVAGEIGRFLDDYVWKGPDGKEIRYTCWRTVNEQIHAAAKRIPKMKVVSSEGLLDRGDVLHFGTPSLRVLGRRYADAMRTFVAYCSTGYWGYICPANLVAAGGYKASKWSSK